MNAATGTYHALTPIALGMPNSESRRRATLGAIVTAGLSALLTTNTASAALFLILNPASGPPGTEVTGRTVGSGTFTAPVEPLRTFFVGRGAADAVSSPDDARLGGGRQAGRRRRR